MAMQLFAWSKQNKKAWYVSLSVPPEVEEIW